jgi:hypothetical protein
MSGSKVVVTEDTVVITLPRVTQSLSPSPAVEPATGSATPATCGASSHSPDFSSVVWRGQVFTFSPKQRLIVAALWRAREQGYLYLSSDVLLEAAESDGGKVRNLFAKHPAWGEFVLPAVAESGTPGTYRLAGE